MKQSIIWLLIGLLVITGQEISAQNCLDNLEDASRAYYNGRFGEVINLLDDCDYNTLDEKSREEVFELLIKANLLLEKMDSADAKMSLLLKNNPLYTPRANDILLFRELFNTYTLINRWNFGFTAGLNIPDFVVLKYQSIGAVVNEPASYTSQPGISLGLNGEVMLIKNLYANLGLIYERMSYSYSEIILEYQQLDVNENLNILNLPLNLRYEIPIGSFKPFINIGISTHFLLKSRLGLDLRAIPTEIPVPYVGIPYKTDNYDISSQRTGVMLNYVLGGGLRKSFGTYQVELAVNYEYGLNNLVEESERLSNNELINTYFYIPDDLKVNKLRFSFGIYKSILIPKKR